MKKTLLISLLVTTVSMKLFSQENKLNNISFYIEHSKKELLSVEVSLDDNIYFKKIITPAERMPPIIYNSILHLSDGMHTIRFLDRTRNIEEKIIFKAESTKTILVRMEKDILEKRYIIISNEKLPIK